MYDGDGKRVKSVFNGTTTTYFVGNHYEVANGVVTKYYYAGDQRIALRTNGVLNFLVGDHLGSTTLTTNAMGGSPVVIRYKAWGEERYTFGDMPTKCTYTGQYSYVSDFGLHFYNARWYDSSLGRFAQADTIVPNGVQGWDSYAYVNNNPVRHTNPTGHKACTLDGNGNCDDTEEKIVKFFDYLDNQILNNNKKGIKKIYKDDVLGTMNKVVKKTAAIFGNDWNTFLDVTTYAFTGYYGHGYEAMWQARQSAQRGFSGYFNGDSGFNADFVDKSNQVRHFWAGFATAADPYGDNPSGVGWATFGNNVHDFFWDSRAGNDDVTVMDYKLTLTEIDIAKQVGNQIKTPGGLATVLEYRLGINGPGYIGGDIDPAQWFTPGS